MNRGGIMRAGVVGTEFIVIPQTDSTRRIPGIELAAACDSVPEWLEKIEEAYGIKRGYTDWWDMVTDKDIQVIHNCTSNHPRGKTNRAVTLTGKHIHVEKPLSLGAARAKSLWQLAMEQGVTHGVNHQYRLSGAVQEIRARVMEREGGRPLYISNYYLQDSATHHMNCTSCRMPETSPIRILADTGAHQADTVARAMGQPTQAIYAQIHTRYPLRPDTTAGEEAEISSDDTTFMMARSEDKTPGTAVFFKCAAGHKDDLAVMVNEEQREYTWQ